MSFNYIAIFLSILSKHFTFEELLTMETEMFCELILFNNNHCPTHLFKHVELSQKSKLTITTKTSTLVHIKFSKPNNHLTVSNKTCSQNL